MHQTVRRLTHTVAARGLEWLNQKIMALPEACGKDHPDLLPLAMAARTAPILSGLCGRMSPLEVVVRHRVSLAMIGQATARCLDGTRDPASLHLFHAGAHLYPRNPGWHLASHCLLHDRQLPLVDRIGLDSSALEGIAERALTRPQLRPSLAEIMIYGQLVAHVYQYGMVRPRFGDKRSFSTIHQTLQQMMEWAFHEGCTRSLALTTYCLRLVDPDHDITEAMVELMQSQRPDGSFAPHLGHSVEPQDFATGGAATLLTMIALHAGLYRPGRGPVLTRTCDRPFQTMARQTAEAALKMSGVSAQSLEHAIILGRAVRRDLTGTLPISFGVLQPAQLVVIARLCFGDAGSARHLRHRINLPEVAGLKGLQQVEANWLRGKPVVIGPGLPRALMALWKRSAIARDDRTFMQCTRWAAHFHVGPLPDDIRAMACRIAQPAQDQSLNPSLEQLVSHVDRLNMLAHVFDAEQAMAAVA